MIMKNRLYRRRRRTRTIRDPLLRCFAFWPLFWNLWGVLRLPNALFGTTTSIYILWALTLLMLLFSRRIKLSPINSWLLFLTVIIIETYLTHSYGAFINITVIMCGYLFCAVFVDREFDYVSVLKCVYLCGLFICLSLIIESFTGVFRTSFIHIYTEESQKVRLLNRSSGGGILPYSASAGCFIYSGMAAYLAMLRMRKKKRKPISSILVEAVFVLCMILIRKRGLLLDIIFSIFAIRLLSIKKKDIGTVNLNKLIKTICVLLIGTLVLYGSYNSVQIIKDSFESILGKFDGTDITSGRLKLYGLAVALLRSHIFTGIGWGRYRSLTQGFFGISDISYAAHNVYLQLLCETGIIGFAAFLIALIATLVYGIKKYRRFLNGTDERIYLIRFGIIFQLFFAAYCMTGNPLYDYNFLIMYFVGVLFTTIPIKGAKTN